MDMYLALAVVIISVFGSLCGILSIILWINANRKLEKLLSEMKNIQNRI